MRIENSVIVVTGASSGIGRATAVELARRGAKLVLVARREHALAEVARECGGEGVLVAPADVADAAAVERVAERAVAEFGRIDGWVNNAGVTMFGRLVDVPLDDVRRLLDVNLMGQVHGARAALPRMIAQGSGVLVNVSSILGVIAQPYGSAYTMSKFAVRGLTFSLRQELRLSGVRGVHVSAVLPAAIDTPVYASAANHSGRRISPPPPVYRPEVVANVILSNAVKPQREVIVGGSGMVMALGQRIAPRIMDKALTVRGAAFRVQRGSRADTGTDNLAQPLPGNAATRGDYEGHVSRTSVLTSITQRPIVSKAAALLAGTAVARRLVQRTGQQGAADAPGTEPGDAGAEQIDLTTGAPAPTQVPRPTDSTGQHRGQDQVAVDATTTDSGTADRPV